MLPDIRFIFPNIPLCRIMENKRKTVEEFISKGERLMEDPKSPKVREAAKKFFSGPATKRGGGGEGPGH